MATLRGGHVIDGNARGATFASEFPTLASSAKTGNRTPPAACVHCGRRLCVPPEPDCGVGAPGRPIVSVRGQTGRVIGQAEGRGTAPDAEIGR